MMKARILATMESKIRGVYSLESTDWSYLYRGKYSETRQLWTCPLHPGCYIRTGEDVVVGTEHVNCPNLRAVLRDIVPSAGHGAIVARAFTAAGHKSFLPGVCPACLDFKPNIWQTFGRICAPCINIQQRLLRQYPLMLLMIAEASNKDCARLIISGFLVHLEH
jgi:hypothetical protein